MLLFWSCQTKIHQPPQNSRHCHRQQQQHRQSHQHIFSHHQPTDIQFIPCCQWCGCTHLINRQLGHSAADCRRGLRQPEIWTDMFIHIHDMMTDFWFYKSSNAVKTLTTSLEQKDKFKIGGYIHQQQPHDMIAAANFRNQ